MSAENKLFAALLKYWRNKRGLSQLDLAMTAEISARHISFLETGRASPSKEMVLLLAATLDLPLRERNTMLREAGFAEVFAEPRFDALEDSSIRRAVSRMLQHHEPYPMLVMNKYYDILQMNKGAHSLFKTIVGELPGQLNAFSAFFDPALLQPYILDWEKISCEMISRLHRESLHQPHDKHLATLLKSVLTGPSVLPESHRPDLSLGTHPVLTIRFHVGKKDIAFITTLTSFNAPQNVTLDELQIESYFPHDETTAQFCVNLAD